MGWGIDCIGAGVKTDGRWVGGWTGLGQAQETGVGVGLLSLSGKRDGERCSDSKKFLRNTEQTDEFGEWRKPRMTSSFLAGTTGRRRFWTGWVTGAPRRLACRTDVSTGFGAVQRLPMARPPEGQSNDLTSIILGWCSPLLPHHPSLSWGGGEWKIKLHLRVLNTQTHT